MISERKTELNSKGIRKDAISSINCSYRYNLLIFSCYFVVLSFVTVVSFTINLHTGIKVFFLVYCLVYLVLALYFLINYLIRIYRAVKGYWTVTVEELFDVGGVTVHDGLSLFRGKSPGMGLVYFGLTFFPGRMWHMPMFVYGWSRNRRTSRSDLFKMSCKGDKFFVVTLDKSKEIVAAYSTDLFSYNEN